MNKKTNEYKETVSYIFDGLAKEFEERSAIEMRNQQLQPIIFLDLDLAHLEEYRGGVFYLSFDSSEFSEYSIGTFIGSLGGALGVVHGILSSFAKDISSIKSEELRKIIKEKTDDNNKNIFFKVKEISLLTQASGYEIPKDTKVDKNNLGKYPEITTILMATAKDNVKITTRAKMFRFVMDQEKGPVIETEEIKETTINEKQNKELAEEVFLNNSSKEQMKIKHPVTEYWNCYNSFEKKILKESKKDQIAIFASALDFLHQIIDSDHSGFVREGAEMIHKKK